MRGRVGPHDAGAALGVHFGSQRGALANDAGAEMPQVQDKPTFAMRVGYFEADAVAD